jgi:hypothetical protein
MNFMFYISLIHIGQYATECMNVVMMTTKDYKIPSKIPSFW